MAETIFARVRRVLSASVEDAVDNLEKAGGASVMREAVREVERALEEAVSERDAVRARRLLAVRQIRMVAERGAALEDKARFALEQGREDLAEAALQRQLDLEVEAARLEERRTESEAEEQRLAECVHALDERKSQMESELAAFEAASREAVETAAPASGCPGEKRADRAEAAFNRAMNNLGGATMRATGETVAKVAEIDALQRASRVSERLAALRRDAAA